MNVFTAPYTPGNERQYYWYAPTPSELSERFLPKPSIEVFDGDPFDYWGFVNRFEIHIASRVATDDLRLVYLLQHCSKRIYEKLNHFAGGANPTIGYNQAWQELYRRYGQPHIISRSCEERLLKVTKLSQNDVEGLENFAVLLIRCQTSIVSNNDLAALNSVNFLSALVQKLPNHVQRNWVTKALEIEQRHCRLALFGDFVEFVVDQSTKANSTFSRALFSTTHHRGKENPKHSFGNVFATMAPTTSKSTSGASQKSTEVKHTKVDKCACCAGKHVVAECPEFRKKSYEERKLFVIDEKLCWRCLQSGHVVKNCRSKLICEVKTCSDKHKATHHTLLHRPVTSPAAVSAAGVCGTTMPLPENNGSSVSNANQKMWGSFLDILPVRVRSGNVEVLTYALLDSGSSLSFCGRKLIDVLNVYEAGTPIKASLETLTTKLPERFHTKVFDFDVLPLSGTSKFKMSKVMMIDSIPVSLSSRNVGKCVEKFPHLLDVELPVVNNATVTLLIGNDNALLHFPVETRTAPNPMEAPQAIKTLLGWILKGPNFSGDKGETSIGKSINLFLSGYRVPKQIRDLSDQIVTDDGEVFPSPFEFDTTNIDELMHWLKSNRELMEFGMKYSREDVVAYDLLARSVCQVDGHFQLPLLWRNAATEMPESLAMARKRLVGVKKRLERNPELKKKYCQQMGIVLSNIYAELVPEDEIDSSKRVWYIPHHPILNP